MKACVVGYGSMGKIVCDLLKEDFAFVVAPECENKCLSDVKSDFDVIIDFSNPANLDMIIYYAYRFKKPVVFATTGFSNEDYVKIKKLSNEVPVLVSSNFSLGVILVNRLVRQITPILKDDFDIEIIEAHHHNKVDAPSGTAKMLLNSVVEGSGFKPVYGRSGYAPRKPNEVGVHAVRGGSIVGNHDVIFAGEDEIITLSHQAQSKKIFAVGAIKAAKFLIEQKIGFYDMVDVLFGDN